MLWIILGTLLVLCVRNHFDMQGVGKDVRGIAKLVRKIARELARAVRRAVKEAQSQPAVSRAAAEGAEGAAQAESAAAQAESAALAEVKAETPQENVIPQEAEGDTGIAAMLANVPTIDFPKEDPKYDSSRKYMYA